MKKSKRTILQNPRFFVPYWFSLPGRDLSMSGAMFDTLWLDYTESVLTLNDDKFRGVNEKNMQKAFNDFLRILPQERIKALAESLVCETPSLTELQKWITAVAKDSHGTDLDVVAHWCWLVKRKALGLPVMHHIMPIVVGPQGSGKTMAISKLIGPLDSCRLSADVPMLSEQSTYQSMSLHLVVMFDELAGIQRMDMNVLKRQISAETNSFRPLYKQDMITVPQRCSFIGASNTKIDESIFDSTGMRRFYQIISPAKVDWDAINAIDYKALWLGIDETLPEGYLNGEQLSKVHKIQQAYTIQDEIELFIQQGALVSAGADNEKEIDARMLYQHYSVWAKEHGTRNPLGYSLFCKKLINRGVSCLEKRNSNDTRVRYFKVSPKCIWVAPVTGTNGSTILEFNIEAKRS